MKDFFLAFYRMNEEYHDRKEQMVWTAAAVYFAFSASFVAWWLAQTPSSSTSPYTWIGVFLSLLYLLAITFVASQNWYKCRSVHITRQLNKLMRKMDAGPPPSLETLHSAASYPQHAPMSQKLRHFWGYGRTGVLVIAGMSLFYAGELSLLLSSHTGFIQISSAVGGP